MHHYGTIFRLHLLFSLCQCIPSCIRVRNLIPDLPMYLLQTDCAAGQHRPSTWHSCMDIHLGSQVLIISVTIMISIKLVLGVVGVSEILQINDYRE